MGFGDCDFSRDEFKGVSDSADPLLLRLSAETGLVLLERDFLGDECADDSAEPLRDLERLERSTELECDGGRSENMDKKTSCT